MAQIIDLATWRNRKHVQKPWLYNQMNEPVAENAQIEMIYHNLLQRLQKDGMIHGIKL